MTDKKVLVLSKHILNCTIGKEQNKSEPVKIDVFFAISGIPRTV